jgi:hypothetical protein
MILLALFSCQAFAQSQFVFPGPAGTAGFYQTGINFVLGQPQTFRWTTNASAVAINLIQEQNSIIADGIQWALSRK